MTDLSDSRPWISLRAVARILAVDVKTAAGIIRAGKIRSRHLPGVRFRRYARVDVVRVAQAAEAAGTEGQGASV
jgi:hypothetical protein